VAAGALTVVGCGIATHILLIGYNPFYGRSGPYGDDDDWGGYANTALALGTNALFYSTVSLGGFPMLGCFAYCLLLGCHTGRCAAEATVVGIRRGDERGDDSYATVAAAGVGIDQLSRTSAFCRRTLTAFARLGPCRGVFLGRLINAVVCFWVGKSQSSHRPARLLPPTGI
jgi:hypothetical protein